MRQCAENTNCLLHNVFVWLQTFTQPEFQNPLAIPQKFTGLGKEGFSFLSSTCHFEEKQKVWNVHGFFPTLNNHINGQCRDSKILLQDCSLGSSQVEMKM
jgi:hypothetical protein